ncbi:MAG: DUF1553 domain-containing protein [Planctomycetales bacterium]|nr:DUF1553 domain-containing protein [Planctomycetales bacterium]
MQTRRVWLLAMLIGSLCHIAAAQTGTPADAVEFNRDLRPILSDICLQCHGPDANQRKAELRLDTQAGMFAERDGQQILVAGKPLDSEFYLRLIAEDESERMPPAKSGKKLTARQIDQFRRWIEQGAKWQGHWSFTKPQRPAVPKISNLKSEIRNPIDNFILSRLERDGLTPSPAADKTTLIRRLTLDLTGFPPTPAEVDAFVTDPSSNAYEKLVDRLLASPRYGERMAARWLDAARYADTHGYQTDGERHMWRWRDWVIEAFNSNMPFDQFTIDQLAGDMDLNPSLDQRIATGFNRNHRGNSEGGIIPEEYAVEYVVDRVETTGTVWLGLTLGCARCHDHKYDPVSQREFYELFAFFNNVPEKGRAVKYGNSPPYIQAPTREQQRQLDELDRRIKSVKRKVRTLKPELVSSQAAWERSPPATLPVWTMDDGLLVNVTLDDGSIVADQFTHDLSPPYGGVATLEGEPRTAPESALRHDSSVITILDGGPKFGDAFRPGRIGRAFKFDGRNFIDAGGVADFGFYDKFTLAAWVFPYGERGGTIVSRMTDVANGDGYSLILADGKLQLNLVKRWLDDSLRVETKQPLEPDGWHHVLATYDGSRDAKGVRVYIDGELQPLRIVLDELNQSFAVKEPLRIGGGNGPGGRFVGLIDDVRIYRRVLTGNEAAIVATSDSLAQILAIPVDRRTLGQRLKLDSAYLALFAAEPIRAAHTEFESLRLQRDAFVERLPTVMVMEEERDRPRETHVLLRGQYDKPGERVWPGVPVSLTNGKPLEGLGRRELARWIVSPGNPLTARVTVNRLWQMLFGTGLVKTVDDFGAQGEWPSHPELLDWLAVEFAGMDEHPERVLWGRSYWDIKALLKLIVTSATYRQSSKVTPTMLQHDPDNRLLARGPRIRLSAEAIRDQALFVSGLLVERQGGPSVMPYQPEGLWKDLTGTDAPVEHGDNLYRRSMYTFWKRTVAPPTMMTFDASGREMCLVRESRTNTPLQALTLLNEVTFVEAARRLAERVLHDARATPADRIMLAFRLATSRPPRPAEFDVLRRGLDTHLAHYRAHREAALELLRTGESPRDESLDPAELAAYTAIAGLLLNLDEAITKE